MSQSLPSILDLLPFPLPLLPPRLVITTTTTTKSSSSQNAMSGSFIEALPEQVPSERRDIFGLAAQQQ